MPKNHISDIGGILNPPPTTPAEYHPTHPKEVKWHFNRLTNEQRAFMGMLIP